LFLFYRAKKINSAAKWIGLIGGVIGLIISALMVLKGSSKKTAISSTEPKVNSEKIDALKSLDSIKYLDNKATESVEATVRK
jgi:hypothetical protein